MLQLSDRYVGAYYFISLLLCMLKNFHNRNLKMKEKEEWLEAAGGDKLWRGVKKKQTSG